MKPDRWTRPADVRAQVQKLWDRGDILASLVTGEDLFPRRLPLKGPTSADIAENFDEVRRWINALCAAPHCRVEMREIKHRVFGSNSFPRQIWIDSLNSALALIGQQRAANHFMALLNITRERQPLLVDWLARRPLRALALADVWTQLLAIAAWLQANPRPGIYLRQIDIPGVHSKFIEAHRGTLTEWLDHILPVEHIDPSASGINQFAKRYGFLDKPPRIRFRFLDPAQVHWAGTPVQDIALDAHSFARLQLDITRVFITENEINFLAFPHVENGVVIFGAGYGFDCLNHVTWLNRCRVYYWGDIDTHGFAILDQLRNQLGAVESLLMDRATLMAFEALWGHEEKQSVRDLPRLTPEEQALYNDLRDNRIRKNLRLEQERIGFGWLNDALAQLQ
jgi:hypothetical protein